MNSEAGPSNVEPREMHCLDWNWVVQPSKLK